MDAAFSRRRLLGAGAGFGLAGISAIPWLSEPIAHAQEATPEGEGTSMGADASDSSAMAQASPNVVFQPDYVRMLAELAYVWGYPMVNMINRRASVAPLTEPGLLNGVMMVAPVGQVAMLTNYIAPNQTTIACPNQDVVYGSGFFSLDEQPVVVQVPDFGDRFYVYALYDARTDQFGHIGRPYDTAPGHYLVVGPTWNGDVPAGIVDVVQSPTSLANAIPRIFMDDTDADRQAIQPLLNQVMVYPLSEFTGDMKTKDWKDLPTIPASASGGGETKWVVPEKFFDQLPEVLATVPPLPGEETLYGQFSALLTAAAGDAQIKQIMTDTATHIDGTLIKDFLLWKYNGQPAGNGWNRSLHNAEWGLDYYNRTGTSRSNMFDNRPNETQYFYTDDDSAGAALSGSNSYTITFAAGELPPVNGFWSLTLYNEAHFFHPNDLNRYSLGTKNKTLQFAEDGSLTLYAGSAPPGADLETNWLPAPDGAFSLYIRAYWPQAAITDGSWLPPTIAKA